MKVLNIIVMVLECKEEEIMDKEYNIIAKYKVSIVMAVYNVEEYLREAIESIINQDIGFENLQLILVDDGSPDGSAVICDEYAEKYPSNIIVIHKENEGVSSARNEGLKYVQGELVNFLDSDDKLSENTMSKVWAFYKLHSSEIDLISIPLIFFEGAKGDHPLNDKFNNGSRVIDLTEEWGKPQLSGASSFFKATLFDEFKFDTRLCYAEDAQLITKILSKKLKMGVVAEAKYLYRKRVGNNFSAIQTSGKTYDWFLPCLEYFNEECIAYCKEKIGKVPLYVQNAVMHDLQWKFLQQTIPENVMDEQEEKDYINRLYRILEDIDSEVIFFQRNLTEELKLYLIQKKFSKTEIVKKCLYLRQRDYYYCIKDMVLYQTSRLKINLHFINITENEISIEGNIFYPMLDLKNAKLFVTQGVNKYEVTVVNTKKKSCLGNEYSFWRDFKVIIPIINDKNSFKFHFFDNDTWVECKNIVYGKYSPITNKLKNAYYYKNGIKISAKGTSIIVNRVTNIEVLKQELKYIKELLKKKDCPGKKIAVGRLLYYTLKPFVPKNIWLITDKADRADDNGEAFFVHCMKNKKEIGCYPVFAIKRDTLDYKRLRKIGPVIPYMSIRYKLCHLLAKHTISAYTSVEITAPFLDKSCYYRDILNNNKVVFLQHGIIKDDISNVLNRINKNYALFVTSAKREFDSVVQGDYGYRDGQIILTGLPRYDRLYNNENKKITIMPTWKRSLFSKYNTSTSLWELQPGFEKSTFYKFYNSLLNSPKLLQAIEKNGYQLQFIIHPTMFHCLKYFNIHPSVKVFDLNVVYRDVFAESSLIITDYSSAVFDMAYLRKPILYTHFEKNHYADGYFDYERDGFGEVEYDLESTIARIVEYVENDCKLKDKYRTRIDEFFMFSDKNCSERVCNEIIKLDKASTNK